jgi:integration host factor subunit alpha
MTSRTITRADLIDELHARTKLAKPACATFLSAMLGELELAIIAEEQVKLSGFGNFVVRTKKERVGRNPKTGKEVPITPRRVVTFRPSQILRERINSGRAR